MLYFLRVIEGRMQIRYEVVLLFGHDGDVVHVCMDIATNLVRGALLHGALVGGSLVLQT
jgi:hypothetical protein